MGGAHPGQNSNGEKLEVDLNLVPFIDLLSTLVLFLLLTVVWVQIGAIPASNEGKGKSTLSQIDQAKLIVTLTKTQFDLSWPTALSSKNLPKRAANLEHVVQLVQKVLKSGARFPSSVRADDQVEYSAVIAAVDMLKEAGLTDIAIGVE